MYVEIGFGTNLLLVDGLSCTGPNAAVMWGQL